MGIILRIKCNDRWEVPGTLGAPDTYRCPSPLKSVRKIVGRAPEPAVTVPCVPLISSFTPEWPVFVSSLCFLWVHVFVGNDLT